MIKESYKILNTARRYIVKHMQYIVKHISAPAGLGKTLRLSRDHGISPKGFLTEGRPIWSPFLTFLKKLFNYFQIFNFLRSRAGWSLVLSGSRVLLVTIRALSTLSILLTISLFMISIFYFLICPFQFYIS